VRATLARAGVLARVSTVPIALLYEDHYEVPGDGAGMGIATWCADWPGLAGRGALQPLVDGRVLRPLGNTDYSGLNEGGLDRAMDAASVAADRPAAPADWQAA